MDAITDVQVANRERAAASPPAAPGDIDLVQERLYLGAETASCDQLLLARLGVTHVLTVEQWVGLPEYDGITYKRVSVADRASEPIHLHFEACSRWIGAAIAGGGTVLVHCHAGISRSATVVAAHLMLTLGIGADEAISAIKARRKHADPNPGFRRRLATLERARANDARNRLVQTCRRAIDIRLAALSAPGARRPPPGVAHRVLELLGLARPRAGPTGAVAAHGANPQDRAALRALILAPIGWRHGRARFLVSNILAFLISKPPVDSPANSVPSAIRAAPAMHPRASEAPLSYCSLFA